MARMQQKLGQVQKLALTQSMQQSLRFLQLPVPELREYLQEVSLSNPLLELEETPADFSSAAPAGEAEAGDGEVTLRRSEALIWEGREPSEGAQSDLAVRPESFAEYLERQLGQMALLDDADRARCLYLVGCLNTAGYLDCSLAELAAETEQSVFDMEQALFVLQSLDPAGVGARSLSECLLLQLERGRHFSAVMVRLVRPDGLALLAKQDLRGLSRLLGVSAEETRRAAAAVRALNPIPSAGFDSGTATPYAFPEATITVEDGQVVVEMNRYLLPKVSINADYCAILGQESAQDAQVYLREKLGEAKSVLTNLENRTDTLYRLLSAVVRRQQEYFLGGGALAPMTMGDLADDLGLSPSTVSRAVRDKTVQFRGRTLALRTLFTAALSDGRGEIVSADSARRQLRRFIAAEDPAAPLSDEALCAALAGVQIPISRRTVAKYRAELNIPSARERLRAARQREGDAL